MEWDLERVRALFPVTKNRVYLNHAATCPLAAPVAEAVHKHVDDLTSNASTNYEAWEVMLEELRGRCAALLGCTSAEVALTGSTSEGANIVARGLGFRPGENIVVPDMEFPANLFPWKALEQDGVSIRIVPLSEGRVTVDAILEQADARTRLVAVSSVAYHNGYRIDLETLGAALEDRGIPLYVDAIQSLGALPLDVRQCRIAFAAADSHKWLLGMEGAGLFYCASEWLDRIRPPYVSWRSVKDPFDFEKTTIDLLGTAGRFEYASYNIAGFHGFNAAAGLLLDLGIDSIAQRILSLTDHLAARMKERGIEIVSPRNEKEKSGIVTFRAPGGRDAEALVMELASRKISLTARGGGIRVSPHFYNTVEELDLLMEALA